MTIRTIARSAAIIGASAAATYAFALTGATDAKAEPANTDEVAYLMTLDEFAVPYADDDAAIAVGYSICDAFRQGVPIKRIIQVGVVATNGVYDTDDVSHIAGAAAGALCPDDAPTLHATA